MSRSSARKVVVHAVVIVVCIVYSSARIYLADSGLEYAAPGVSLLHIMHLQFHFTAVLMKQFLV